MINDSTTNFRLQDEVAANVLEKLSSNENLLEDESAIESINASRITMNELNEKQSIAEQTDKQIDIARVAYMPIASHAAKLFFTVGNKFKVDKSACFLQIAIYS